MLGNVTLPAPGDRNFKRYFAIVPSGMHPLGYGSHAGKNISSQTVHGLFQVADILKRYYRIKRTVKDQVPTKLESSLPDEAMLGIFAYTLSCRIRHKGG